MPTWILPTPTPPVLQRSRVTLVGGPSDGVTLPVTAGTIIVDAASDVRRFGSFTVAGLPEWTPADAGDALDPRTGTELLVEQWSGTGWVPQGVFGINKPNVSTSKAGVRVRVEVADRSQRVRLAGMDRRWVISAGTLASDAIRSILAQIAPWIPCAFEDTLDTVESDILLEFGDDPWAACLDIAESVGLELYVDTLGYVVTASATAALAAPAVPVTWVEVDRDIDTASIINHVRAEWTPVRPDPLPKGYDEKGGYEDAVDDASSTSVLSWVGRRCKIVKGDRSLLTSAAAARRAAQIELLRALDITYSGSGTAVPDPTLDVGNVTVLSGDRFRITRLIIDLAGGATDVVLGVPPVDMAELLVRALTIPPDRRTREVVTSVNPLRTALASDPTGSQVAVTPTAAVQDVTVGQVIEVLHTGRGERIGIARFIGGTSAYGWAVLADNPYCYFPLDDATTATDAMGNVTPISASGVTYGGAGVGDGVTAITVNGTTGAGVVLPKAAFTGISSFTVEILARATNMTTQRYMAGIDGATNELAFLFQHSAAAAVSGITGAGWANTIGAAYTETAPTAVHHWAISWDGTTAVFYRDGVQIASEAQTWTPANPTLDLFIGGRRASSVGFLGQVGGFAFYKSALPASRILAHAQAAGL